MIGNNQFFIKNEYLKFCTNIKASCMFSIIEGKNNFILKCNEKWLVLIVATASFSWFRIEPKQEWRTINFTLFERFQNILNFGSSLQKTISL